jgi:hypothetical protein
METSLPGLLGGLIGLVIGIVEYRIIAPIVVGKLRASEQGKPAAERAAFERKIGQFRTIFLLVATVGGALAGYMIARAVFG